MYPMGGKNYTECVQQEATKYNEENPVPKMDPKSAKQLCKNIRRNSALMSESMDHAGIGDKDPRDHTWQDKKLCQTYLIDKGDSDPRSSYTLRVNPQLLVEPPRAASTRVNPQLLVEPPRVNPTRRQSFGGKGKRGKQRKRKTKKSRRKLKKRRTRRH